MRKTEWSYTLIFLLLLACNNKNVQELDLITVDVTISYPKKILMTLSMYHWKHQMNISHLALPMI